MANLRDKNILVIGSVKFPGTYTLSGGASALQAIDVAGGISRNGSFRNIKIKEIIKSLKVLIYMRSFKG